jgi:hypothetical protein
VRSRSAIGTVVAVLVAVAGIAASPRAAVAHESTLDALTLDLLLDQSGLVVVDGATNHATYPEAPSPAERAVIAERVGEALGIASRDVQLDAESSTLYHEVGFRMSLHAAFSNALPAGAVQIDTAPLQEIAADFGKLILDVCGVAKPGIAVAVKSSRAAGAPGSTSVGAPQIDRSDCHVWNLGVDDPPVQITARATVPGSAEPEAHDRVTLPCGSPSSGGDPTFVVDGAVTYPNHVLQAHASGPRATHLLVADAVFGFRVGARVEVVVPSASVGHVTIGAREGPRAARRLVVETCPTAQAETWNMSVLRIWTDEARCVPLLIETAKSRTIRLPVGAPCKGRVR